MNHNDLLLDPRQFTLGTGPLLRPEIAAPVLAPEPLPVAAAAAPPRDRGFFGSIFDFLKRPEVIESLGIGLAGLRNPADQGKFQMAIMEQVRANQLARAEAKAMGELFTGLEGVNDLIAQNRHSEALTKLKGMGRNPALTRNPQVMNALLQMQTSLARTAGERIKEKGEARAAGGFIAGVAGKEGAAAEKIIEDISGMSAAHIGQLGQLLAKRDLPTVHTDPSSGMIFQVHPITGGVRAIGQLPRDAQATSLGGGNLFIHPAPGQTLKLDPKDYPENAKLLPVPGTTGYVLRMPETGQGLKMSSNQGLAAKALGIKVGSGLIEDLGGPEAEAIRKYLFAEDVNKQMEALIAKDVAVSKALPWASNPISDKSITPVMAEGLDAGKRRLDLTPFEANQAFKKGTLTYLNDKEMQQLRTFQVQRQTITNMRSALEGVLARGGEPGANWGAAVTYLIKSRVLGGTEATAMFDALMGPGRIQMAGAFQGGVYSQLSDKDINAVAEGLPKYTDKLSTGIAKTRVLQSIFENNERALLGKPLISIPDLPEWKTVKAEIDKAQDEIDRKKGKSALDKAAERMLRP